MNIDFDAIAGRFSEPGVEPLTAALVAGRLATHLKIPPDAAHMGTLAALADIEAGKVSCASAHELGALCEATARSLQKAGETARHLVYEGKLERIARTMQADLETKLGEASEEVLRQMKARYEDGAYFAGEFRKRNDSKAEAIATAEQAFSEVEAYECMTFMRRLKFAVTGK